MGLKKDLFHVIKISYCLKSASNVSKSTALKQLKRCSSMNFRQLNINSIIPVFYGSLVEKTNWQILTVVSFLFSTSMIVVIFTTNTFILKIGVCYGISIVL